MSVSERIGEVLIESPLSSPKMVDRLGGSHTTISNLKNGKPRSLGSDFIEVFIKEFPYISLDWIFTGKGHKEKVNFYRFLEDKGIEKNIDPNVAELILHLYEVIDNLNTQIKIQGSIIKRIYLKP